ncbi:hypothetical protein [Rhodoplanes sp. Z2-YC6860]|uniref:hypothetical protein n=1 Tax=Rhodoplanes sp. Z2-YC6860 TaxID=674703 RepID=UPI0012ED8006|nr:hypothetical protein [Rhodoplanes sp. Z2-YC6860]
MSVAELVYLCGVIVAFLTFSVTLAWCQHQTSDFVRPEESPTTASADDHDFRKAA